MATFMSAPPKEFSTEIISCVLLAGVFGDNQTVKFARVNEPAKLEESYRRQVGYKFGVFVAVAHEVADKKLNFDALTLQDILNLLSQRRVTANCGIHCRAS